MTIDNAVPIPKRRSGRRSRVAAELRQMRPGQSIYLDKTPAQGNMVANYAFFAGNYTVRREGGGCRVWCLKNPHLDALDGEILPSDQDE